MKKLLVLLMVLAIAMPAMAGVTLTESGKTGTTVTVGYNFDGTGSAPRAFALVLTATGGTITSVTPAKTGESTAASKGFGIFPGTIVINSAGVVTSYGTPVEPTDLPGGPSATGTNRVVVALGSLYVGDTNRPAAIGNLFTVVCSTGTTALAVAEEDAYRGGVVAEDASALTVATLNIAFVAPPCFTGTPAEVAVWNAWGQPANWCGTCWRNGDINVDNFVTFGDVSQVMTYFKNNDTTGRGDYNMDGFLTFGDVSAVFTKFKAAATCP